jgi:tetratricopeptide (TPR) repeat protein
VLGTRKIPTFGNVLEQLGDIMTDISIPIGGLLSLYKWASDLIKSKCDRHDAEVNSEEAILCLKNNNCDMAMGFINSAIEKCLSDPEALLPLYLLKSVVFLCQSIRARSELIDEHPIRYLDEEAKLLSDKALESIDKALAINPRCAWCYYIQGHIFMSLLRFPDSLRSFDNALEFKLENKLLIDIYDFQAKFCFVEDPQKAMKCCENMLKIDPKNEQALTMLRVIRRVLSASQNYQNSIPAGRI